MNISLCDLFYNVRTQVKLQLTCLAKTLKGILAKYFYHHNLFTTSSPHSHNILTTVFTLSLTLSFTYTHTCKHPHTRRHPIPYRSLLNANINILNNTDFIASGAIVTLSNNLWSSCGVGTPGFCNVNTSSLNVAQAPTFVKGLLLLTAIVMAMLLL